MERTKITLDIKMLRALTGYAHWIPITKGLHEEFFAENFPGWDWNDLVPRLLDKKILKFNERDNPDFIMLSQGLFIASDIQAIEFIPQKNGVRVMVQLKG